MSVIFDEIRLRIRRETFEDVLVLYIAAEIVTETGDNSDQGEILHLHPRV